MYTVDSNIRKAGKRERLKNTSLLNFIHWKSGPILGKYVDMCLVESAVTSTASCHTEASNLSLRLFWGPGACMRSIMTSEESICMRLDMINEATWRTVHSFLIKKSWNRSQYLYVISSVLILADVSVRLFPKNSFFYYKTWKLKGCNCRRKIWFDLKPKTLVVTCATVNWSCEGCLVLGVLTAKWTLLRMV